MSQGRQRHRAGVASSPRSHGARSAHAERGTLSSGRAARPHLHPPLPASPPTSPAGHEAVARRPSPLRLAQPALVHAAQPQIAPWPLELPIVSQRQHPGAPGWRFAGPSGRAKFAGGERCCHSKLASCARCWLWSAVHLVSLAAGVGTGVGPSQVFGGLGLGSSREARRHLPFLPSQAGPLPTCQVERTQEG